MKQLVKLAMVFVFVAACGVSAKAEMFEVGAKVGGNLHNASNTPTVTGSAFALGITGYVAGDWTFTDMLGMEVDLGLAVKGLKSTDTVDATATLNTGAMTLDMPIMFKIRFMQGEFVPYATMGVNPYYIMSVSASTTSTVAAATTAAAAVAKTVGGVSIFKSIGFGVLGGLGFNYYFQENMAMTMDGRFAYSLTNISDVAATTIRPFDITLLMGMTFKI